MKKIWLTTIVPLLQGMIGEAGAALFRSYEMIPTRGQVIIGVGGRDVQVQCGDAQHSLCMEVLIAREIGSDNAALRMVLTFVAGLPVGRPALTFGCILTKRGRFR
eukprot:2482677-Pyramimonas_sp.AAC.1